MRPLDNSIESALLKIVLNENLCQAFEFLRDQTEQLVSRLSEEDQCVQSMPDASPIKWHLGHTTWFFESVVLLAHCAGYEKFSESFSYLFNSYYESLGPRQPRPQRGLITRPSLSEVMAYRAHVTRAMALWLAQSNLNNDVLDLIVLGIHHEQQHQELMVTDALHLFSCHPFLPDSRLLFSFDSAPHALDTRPHWIQFESGLYEFGQALEEKSEFAFDNEQPRHKRWLNAFEMSDQLVTQGEFLTFILDGGYQNPSWWLSEGWSWVSQTQTSAPTYWFSPNSPRNSSQEWQVFGVNGLRELNLNEPVSHLNFFEAEAFSQWSGARLPTEFEWELAFGHPKINQMQGSVWQWTRSSYEPYPGFQANSGAIREYNGKFMVGQQVLRGSSWATPAGHARKTYRNFFPPAAQWQITGLRLARDCKQ
ncbi:ergothioneine biosynthesis protein EgtB [Limnohabitans sp.]|uniref:ergothioneine biosynthesis protein EgtB n=1 Tax=Limnohabitans sp. TaxID=1907725 RepID=UPI0038BBF340